MKLGHRWIAPFLMLTIIASSITIPVASANEGSRQAPEPPIAVRIDRFDDGTPAAVGAPVTFIVQAIADWPMQFVELWADELLVQTAPTSNKGMIGVAVLEWTPVRSGRSSVVARAVDAFNNVAHSSTMTFDVAASRQTRSAEPGVTQPLADGVARALGVPAEINSTLRQLRMGEIPEGAEDVRDAAEDAATSSALGPLLEQCLRVEGVTAVCLRKATGRVRQGFPGHAQVPPPRLQVTMQGCTARALLRGGPTVNDGDHGMALFHKAPSAHRFSLVETREPGRSDLSQELGGGRHLYYAVAFEGNFASYSDIVAAPTESSCTTDRWSGDVSIIDGKLHAPTIPNEAYLWIAVDGGRRFRVPADGTVERRHGELDFTDVFPAIEGNTLSIWAVSVEGEIELTFGAAELQAGEARIIDLIGAYGRADLALVRPTTNGDGDLVDHLKKAETLSMYEPDCSSGNCTTQHPQPRSINTFRWGSRISWATHGVLQVTASYPGSGQTLYPPALLETRVVPIDPYEFNVDLKSLLVPASGSTGTNFSWNFNNFSSGSGLRQSLLKSPLWVQQHKPAAIWVRVVPMAGNEPLDAVSDPVVFSLQWSPPVTEPTEPPPPSIKPFDRAGVITPAYLPNSKYYYCLRVLENPNFANVNWFMDHPDLVHPILNEGDTVCPAYGGSDDGFDITDMVEVLGGLAEFWDAIANAYSYLKAEVVTLIAEAIQCDEVFDEEDCEEVVGFVVDAALMYFGIPPSLPQSKDLANAAKGEISEAVLVYLESNGIDCNVFREYCKDVIEDALGEVQERIKEHTSNGAKAHAQSGGGWLHIADNITVTPEPTGLLQPVVANVTFKRRPGVPLPSSGCKARVGQTGSITGPWKDYANRPARASTWGDPLTGPSFDLSQLAPGEERTILLIHHIPVVWFEAEYFEYGEHWYSGAPGSHYYLLMRHPATQGSTKVTYGLYPNNYACFDQFVLTRDPGKTGTQEPAQLAGQ